MQFLTLGLAFILMASQAWPATGNRCLDLLAEEAEMGAMTLNAQILREKTARAKSVEAVIDAVPHPKTPKNAKLGWAMTRLGPARNMIMEAKGKTKFVHIHVGGLGGAHERSLEKEMSFLNSITEKGGRVIVLEGPGDGATYSVRNRIAELGIAWDGRPRDWLDLKPANQLEIFVTVLAQIFARDKHMADLPKRVSGLSYGGWITSYFAANPWMLNIFGGKIPFVWYGFGTRPIASVVMEDLSAMMQSDSSLRILATRFPSDLQSAVENFIKQAFNRLALDSDPEKLQAMIKKVFAIANVDSRSNMDDVDAQVSHGIVVMGAKEQVVPPMDQFRAFYRLLNEKMARHLVIVEGVDHYMTYDDAYVENPKQLAVMADLPGALEKKPNGIYLLKTNGSLVEMVSTDAPVNKAKMDDVITFIGNRQKKWWQHNLPALMASGLVADLTPAQLERVIESISQLPKDVFMYDIREGR